MSLASEDLSDRIRDMLPAQRVLTERRMFGGRAFMLNGNMVVAAMSDGGMLVRVGKEAYAVALNRPGAERIEMGDRIMTGFVQVPGDVIEEEEALRDWLDLALAFVETLPAK
ncbi:TfoX/Sxy family protein [Devosia sp. RR2S18]|uniref:TfoX/Sxy family protein n=1 Tax=Devosia rhizosphaerae TaxID=3049774 RepID=UPI00253F7CEA|nr:TfoX/Sxy family protein [Devosia sp. RR2S18]WIJ26686.1 TfoX/Sxy family protein [Devosia sp. RR2S18]